MEITVEPVETIRGQIRVPGDKSISHRALLLSSLAEEPVEIEGLLKAADISSTQKCLQDLGTGFVEEKGRLKAVSYTHLDVYKRQILRGGAYKPRSSPYSFQGLGEEGLKILAEARSLTGLPVVTEVLDHASVEVVAEYADILQVGARNMQNFSLLKELGQSGKPVLIKRGMSATIEEWLMAAEYLLSEGNGKVILCERGIRTFERYTRNTLDLSAVPIAKELSHLPVFVDPSHGTGQWRLSLIHI